ncbi:MAG: class I SAM-dependent methyltransferase, partial [Patescibacteria group bacterium]
EELYKEIYFCRLCGGQIRKILDLGISALANNFLTKEEVDKYEYFGDDPKAPLKVVQCLNCGESQLGYNINSETLFSNYLYASDSPGLIRHFENYTNYLFSELKLNKNDVIIDIGSNIGSLLKFFKDKECRVVGIDPAKNLCEVANNNDIFTINAFFNSEVVVNQIPYNKARIINCLNCFAHIPNLDEVIKGIKILMDENSYFIFENAYWLDSVKQKFFDQIYGDHVFFHSLKPLSLFFKKHKMTLLRVEKNDIQGGTIRCYVKLGISKPEESVKQTIKEEEDFGLYEDKVYKDLKNEIQNIGDRLRNKLLLYKSQNKKICAFSYPAKATTLCSYFNIGDLFDYVVDDSPFKQNKYTPQFHKKIVDRKYFYNDNPDVAVILAYNFADSIKKSNNNYKGEWVIPF